MAPYKAWPRRRFPADPTPQLFPLTAPPPPQLAAGASKAALRHFKCSLDQWVQVCDAVSSLNELYGCSGIASDRPSAGQESAINNITELVAGATTDRPSFHNDREAFIGLLGSKAYGGECTSVVPYQPQLVSLPDLGSQPVDLSEVLSEKLQRSIDIDHILADDDVVAERQRNEFAQPYLDIHLRQQETYEQFITRLFKSGLIKYSRYRRSRVTAFFVKKKGGQQS